MSRINYVVCTTPRTGSNRLCALLHRTDVAGMQPVKGQGYEYVHLRHRLREAEIDWTRFSLERELETILRATRTKNGAAGFKLMWDHVAFLQAKLPRIDRLELELPNYLPRGTRFVHLVRRDSLKQAISFAKAIQSDKWTAHEEAHFRGEFRYDREQISGLREVVITQDRRWVRMFEHGERDVFSLAYEDLIADEAGTVLRLLDWLGINVPRDVRILNRHYVRQSNEINAEWERRYLEETSADVP